MSKRPGDRPGCYASLEELEGGGTINERLWWARGSELSAVEMNEKLLKLPKLLEELTQSYAVQGAYKGWLLALRKGNRLVGEAALENFQAAFRNDEVLRRGAF